MEKSRSALAVAAGRITLGTMALLAVARAAHAQAAPSRTSCARAVNRDNLVACALEASLAVRGERAEREAAIGRKLAVSPLLPSNPLLSVSGARRQTSGGASRAWNGYVTLGQEIELAGQRGARMRAADRALDAAGARVVSVQRSVAAEAWSAFFEARAAVDEVRLAREVEAVTAKVAKVTEAMAGQGLLPGVDADVAEAAWLAASQARLAAERHGAENRAALATLLGLPPDDERLVLEGDLSPVPGALERGRSALRPLGASSAERPELRAIDAERLAAGERASAYRRARVPNLTVSITAQNDGFDERVLGAGLALPIPLPQPLGRTYAGEIAEAEAVSRRAAADLERARREFRRQLSVAVSALESRLEEQALFTPDRLRRAHDDIDVLAGQVQAARISVRDAVVSQQALIALLHADIDARLAAAQASVDLALAAGMPLEEGAR